MPPPPATRCPRCGFSFAWNGRKCHHCPSPSRARQLWEEIARFTELVGSEKGITQRQLLMIAAGCLARVADLLPVADRTSIDRFDVDPDAIAQEWGQAAAQRPAAEDPGPIALFGLQLVAQALATTKTLDAATVQRAASHWTQAAGFGKFPDREVLSFKLPAELESHYAAMVDRIANNPNYRLTSAWRWHAADDEGATERTGEQAAFHHLVLQVSEYNRQRSQATRAEEVAQCEIARDILGYPEVSVAFDSNWRTSTVIAMVHGMYATRDFAAMPILADALQDAGCDEPEILEHCRAEKPHLRGCWVCEAVLCIG